MNEEKTSNHRVLLFSQQTLKPVDQSKGENMTSKPLFISHSVANKELADRLVVLLETGIGISDSNIFCSSLEGMGIPSGTNFVEFIRQQIKEPQIVILLLTKEYFKSQFCLSELGASWVLGHNVIPLLVQPLEFKDIKAVLAGVQLLKIEDKKDLNQMQAELVSELEMKGKAFAIWEVRRDNFLEDLPLVYSPATDADSVPIDEYLDLKQNYEDAVEEIKKSEELAAEKDELISKLKQAKDASEVNKIITESLDDIEVFESLVKNAKSALYKLPTIVQEAIYYDFRDERLVWPGFGYDDRRDSIRDAIESDYLSELGDEIKLVSDDPKVSRAIDALYELKSFCDAAEHENTEFYDYYTENYDHRLKFTSKRFWDTHL